MSRTIVIVHGILVDGVHRAVDERLEVGTDVDSDTADILVRHGRARELDPADDEPNTDTVADDLHALTIAQLKAVAEHEEVDLGTSTRRADILATIRDVRTGRT